MSASLEIIALQPKSEPKSKAEPVAEPKAEPEPEPVAARALEPAADSPPTLPIWSPSAYESDSGTVELTFDANLSRSLTTDVSFTYATVDDSATAGEDYVAETGDVTFFAGDTHEVFSVTVNGDTTVEPDERFMIEVSGLTATGLLRAQRQ